MNQVTNVVLAGLGGQGVLLATDILANVALAAGHDVKKSEIKGMSQRGGSVTGEVRFGARVFSPMVPSGCADYLLVLEPTQVDPHRHLLRPGGVLITPSAADVARLADKKALNVALLGALSAHLAFPPDLWVATLAACFEESLLAMNSEAFLASRATESSVFG